ncbi:MAG TPA: outer membrane beta-barrel protein [Permianibacter sp.]|nr:outer membrane beta-barrel protein [Permianibacter sp.]
MNVMKSARLARGWAGVALAAVGVWVASPVDAAESGAYVGAAYGVSRVDGADFDDDDQAIKVFLGGRFNPYFGLEVAVNDYGDSRDGAFSSELLGNTLAAVGFLPLNDRFELFAKAGRLWWKDKVRVGDSFRDTLDGNENFYGVGANFLVSDAMGFRLELERYEVKLSRSEIGVELDGTFDVDVVSLGVFLHF